MTRIVLLADAPEQLDALVVALRSAWPDWYGREPPEVTREEFSNRARRDAVPLAVVALDGDALIGAASLSIRSIASHEHLTPWLTGLWVAPERRRAGLGRALVEAVRRHARRLGVHRLHAATASAGSIFAADGWTRFDETSGHGETIGVWRVAP